MVFNTLMMMMMMMMGPEASVQCVDGVRRVLEVFSVDAHMSLILLSVVPRLHLTAEALLQAVRRLSSLYAELALQLGVAYIDVETVFRGSVPAASDDAGCHAEGGACGGVGVSGSVSDDATNRCPQMN